MTRRKMAALLGGLSPEKNLQHFPSSNAHSFELPLTSTIFATSFSTPTREGCPTTHRTRRTPDTYESTKATGCSKPGPDTGPYAPRGQMEREPPEFGCEPDLDRVAPDRFIASIGTSVQTGWISHRRREA